MTARRAVLAVFIDGLKPESVARMPFLASFAHQRRLTTDVGYSITCHSTMYTGVYPSRHKMWFLWQYNPGQSPFRWMPETDLWRMADVLPMRYFLGKMTRLFSDNRSYAGVNVMKFSSLKQWRQFAPTERKLWDEPGYVEDYRTLFEFMRGADITFDVVGLVNVKQHGGALSHVEHYTPPADLPQLTYLFIGEADHVSHVHGQESPQVDGVLKRIDAEVQRVYEQMTRRGGRTPALVCWSDHGHMMVGEQFDIYPHFDRRGIDLKDVLHIVDTNFARFWFTDEAQRIAVVDALADMPAGRVLSDEDCRTYHVTMPDRRYGDVVFYLDHPYMFKKTVWGYGLRTRSVHGYLPDHPEVDGTFISDIPISQRSRVRLTDITPSLLDLLDVDADVEFDGESVWA